MANRNRDEIARDMRIRARTLLPGANVASNSVLGDLFIDVPSEQYGRLYAEAARISTLQSVRLSSGGDLDNIGKNYGRTRRQSTKSTGIVLLTRSQLKQSETVNIPAGSLVSTKRRGQTSGRTVVEFRTLSEVVFDGKLRAVYAATASRYRSLLDQAGINDPYAIEIEVESIIAGSFTNAGRFTITTHNISNISHCINSLPMTGGRSIEDDATFRNRILLALSGNSPEVTGGYLAKALDNSDVEDAILIGPGDELMLRDGTTVDEDGNILTLGTGGAIDIIVRGEILSAPESGAESFIFQNRNLAGIITSPDNDFILGQKFTTDAFGNLFNVGFNNRRVSSLNATDIPNQPISNITSVVGEKSGTRFVEAYFDEDGVERGNYRLLKDVDETDIFGNNVAGPYANSPFGFDRLRWISAEANSGDEEIVRGAFNVTDATLYQDIMRINSVVQSVLISSENAILNQEEFVLGEITAKSSVRNSLKPVRTLQTQHFPVISVRSVSNVRTGERYNVEEIDRNVGTIIYSGRIFPSISDDVQVVYTWARQYDPTFEYRIDNDRIQWPDHEPSPSYVDDPNMGNDIGVILEPIAPDDNGLFYSGGPTGVFSDFIGECIEEEQNFLTQPKIPTFLKVVGNGSGLTTKTLTISGTTITTVLYQSVTVPDQVFTIDDDTNTFFGYWILDLTSPKDRDGNVIGGEYPFTIGPDISVDTTVGYVTRDNAFLEIRDLTNDNVVVVDDFVTLRDDPETKGYLTTTQVAISSGSIPSARSELQVSFLWKVPNPQCQFAANVAVDSDGIPCRNEDGSDFLYTCSRGFPGRYEANCDTKSYDDISNPCDIYRISPDYIVCDNVNCTSYTSGLLDDELNKGNFEVIRFAGNTSSAGIPQISNKRYITVDRIETSTDQLEKLTILSIDTFSQPQPNDTYVIDYDFRSPKENERITIHYNYNKLIGDLQLDIESSRSITADVLVKEGRRIEIVLDVHVIIEPDFDPIVKENEVIDAITELFTSNTLGGKIDPSDVIFTIKSIEGVDDVNIRRLARDGDVGVRSIRFLRNEYFAAANNGINVTIFNSPNPVIGNIVFNTGDDPSQTPTGIIVPCPQTNRGDETTTCT